jgi:hypothetical protein
VGSLILVTWGQVVVFVKRFGGVSGGGEEGGEVIVDLWVLLGLIYCLDCGKTSEEVMLTLNPKDID